MAPAWPGSCLRARCKRRSARAGAMLRGLVAARSRGTSRSLGGPRRHRVRPWNRHQSGSTVVIQYSVEGRAQPERGYLPMDQARRAAGASAGKPTAGLHHILQDLTGPGSTGRDVSTAAVEAHATWRRDHHKLSHVIGPCRRLVPRRRHMRRGRQTSRQYLPRSGRLPRHRGPCAKCRELEQRWFLGLDQPSSSHTLFSSILP